MNPFENSPYQLDDEASRQLLSYLQRIEDRVATLRSAGRLTDETLRDYFGETRFIQVAESNALEGSTLSAGETELAVLKGVTITGHDPAYVRDAIALDRALSRIVELAKDRNAVTDIEQLQEIHGLLLGDRPGAGTFRNQPVRIRGASHVPPKTWREVMDQMEQWETWSRVNATAPAPIRSIVLHAWLAHIHPYIDGNGRTARAISNLELIRSGYPAVIIKRKERQRYIESLAESDKAGDIRSFAELLIDRIEGSLTGLESSARRKQGYSFITEKIRRQQENQLAIWNTSVQLLANMLEHEIGQLIEAVRGSCTASIFPEMLDVDDYVEVCAGRSVPRSFAFKIQIQVPGVARWEKLAFVGYRSGRMCQHFGNLGGPSLYWSSRTNQGFHKWRADGLSSPFAVEITAAAGNGDRWVARSADDSIVELSTTELARSIGESILQQMPTNGET